MRWTGKYIFIFLVLIGILIYGKILFAGFVFDDHKVIANNRVITNSSDIIKIWNLSHVRFLVNLGNSLSFTITGNNPFWFHFINIVIHIINAYLVYLFVGQIQRHLRKTKNKVMNNPFLPVLASLIFLVHPIQTQAVSYVSQRYALVSVLFYLSALLFYLKAVSEKGRRMATYYLISIISTIFAFLSKENSYTLPLSILLLNLTIVEWKSNKVRNSIVYALPFFLPAVFAFIVIYANGAGNLIIPAIRNLSMAQDVKITRSEYFLTQLNVIRTYLRLLFLPINQNADYDYSIAKSLFEGATFLSGILIMSILGLSIFLYKRTKIISFAILFFFLTLSIESSIIPIADVANEHRLYLPMVGFSIFYSFIIVWLLIFFQKKLKSKYGRIFLLLVFCHLAVLSFFTYTRNNVWMNELFLWTDTVKKSPKKSRVHFNLGIALTNQKKFDEALKEFETTVSLDKNDIGAYYNIATIYERKGNDEKALGLYEKALKISPEDLVIRNALGGFYAKRGKSDEAIKQFQYILKADPKNAKAYDSLGVVYLSVGKNEEAFSSFEKAITLNPDLDTAFFNLGVAFYKVREFQKSLSSFKQAIFLNPANYTAYYYAGMASLENKDKTGALEYFQKALMLKPDFKEAKEQIEKLETVNKE